VSLTLAAVTTVPLALLAPGVAMMTAGSAGFVGFFSLRGLNGWLWLLTILGFAAGLDRPAGSSPTWCPPCCPSTSSTSR